MMLCLVMSFHLAPVGFAGPAVVTGEQPEEEKEGEGFSLEEAGFKPGSNIPTLGLEGEEDPLKVVDSVLLKYVINPIFFLAGGVAVLVIMYSAFRIIVARGEEEGITAAKNALIWATAGLALVLLAYTLVRNLVNIVVTQL